VRICLVSRENPFAGDVGGIATYTATVARGLTALGHDVGVISRGTAASRSRDGVDVIELDHRWLPHPGATRLAAMRRIAWAAMRWGPDVVEAPEWQAEGWWLARRGRLPLVTKLHTPTYLVERLNGQVDPPRSRSIRWLERDQAHRSTAVVAPTRAIADRVGDDWKLPDARVSVIPNPADGQAIRRAAAGPVPVGLPRRFFAYVGRLERRKGVHVLADALPRVLTSDLDVHAVLVGADTGQRGGSVGDRLRARAEPVRGRVHLLGELRREAALAIVRRAELVVLPSLWENCANVATEALALGRPILASGGSGLAELIEDGRSGWLVPPGDADALTESLLARLADRDGLRRAGEAARRRADEFEPRAVASTLSEAYEEVASRSKPSWRRSRPSAEGA
jgi:glycogen(starch) synthase